MIPQTATAIKCDDTGITTATFEKSSTCGDMTANNTNPKLAFGTCQKIMDGFYIKAAKSGGGFGAGKKAASDWGDGSGAKGAAETEYDTVYESTSSGNGDSTQEGNAGDDATQEESADGCATLMFAIATVLITLASVIV